MKAFLLNISLALVWTFLQGELRATNFVIGLALGYLIIALSQRALDNQRYVMKVGQVVYFLGFVLWEVFTASIALAWLIMNPRMRVRPGVVAVPLDAETDLEIATLATLITLSPGTLTLDVSDDRSTLYVHTILLDDPDAFRRDIKDRFERRVLRVMR